VSIPPPSPSSSKLRFKMHLGLRLVAALGVILLISPFSSSHADRRPKNIGIKSYHISRASLLMKHTALSQRDNITRTIAIRNQPTGATQLPGLKFPRTPAIRPPPRVRPGQKSDGGTPRSSIIQLLGDQRIVAVVLTPVSLLPIGTNHLSRNILKRTTPQIRKS
jgi:hypothetical protein